MAVANLGNRMSIVDKQIENREENNSIEMENMKNKVEEIRRESRDLGIRVARIRSCGRIWKVAIMEIVKIKVVIFCRGCYRQKDKANTICIAHDQNIHNVFIFHFDLRNSIDITKYQKFFSLSSPLTSITF